MLTLLKPRSLKGPGSVPAVLARACERRVNQPKEYGEMRNPKKILLSLGAAAAVAALATGGTFAVFTDQEAIGGNNIDSGSVEIDLNDGSTDAVVTVTDMAIGDSKDGTLKVENDGDNKANFD